MPKLDKIEVAPTPPPATYNLSGLSVTDVRLIKAGLYTLEKRALDRASSHTSDIRALITTIGLEVFSSDDHSVDSLR